MLNVVIKITLVIALLFGGYGLWDTWMVYNNASSANLAGYKPKGGGDGSNPTLAELMAINGDVCGWLTVDGTSIDYPVLQGADNYTYLNRDVYGEFSLSGSIFLDSDNSREFTDSYSLVYGHHIDGNVMFGELPSFLEADFFQQHQTGTLYLPEATYHIEWFSCVYTDAYDSQVFEPIVGTDAARLSTLEGYLAGNSRQYRDLGLGEGERIIGLSTCSDATTAGRVLLFGRLS